MWLRIKPPAVAAASLAWFWIALGFGIVSGLCPVSAMTIYSKELECPYDGTKFTAALQGSGTSFNSTLDLQPIGAIQTPWPLAECPTNGFVFFKPEFADGELERLRGYVLSDEYQMLRKESVYYRAARLLERDGASHLDVTWALLEATWERHAYASEVVDRLPEDIAAAAGEPKTQLRMQLLRGELLRQLGRSQEATQVFSDLLRHLDRSSDEGSIARYELKLLTQNDRSSNHTVAEALDALTSDPH